MRYAVIDDSREWSSGPGAEREADRVVHPNEIEAEAWRRKGLLRLDEWQMREYVSGNPLPERIVQSCRQIELAAQALGRMSPIPVDFAEDVYWPRIW